MSVKHNFHAAREGAKKERINFIQIVVKLEFSEHLVKLASSLDSKIHEL